MPLNNVELIPVQCPKCGGDMEVPKKLEVIHCMYCGTKFLLTERKPDVHYHLSDGHATIENYYKLFIKHLLSENYEKANNYYIKAQEINVDEAERIFQKEFKNISKAYTETGKKKLTEFKNIKEKYDTNRVIINSIEIEKKLDDCTEIFQIALKYNPNNSETLYFLGELFNHFSSFFSSSNRSRNEIYTKAIWYYKQAYKKDKNNMKAKEKLIQNENIKKYSTSDVDINKRHPIPIYPKCPRCKRILEFSYTPKTCPFCDYTLLN